MTEKMTGEEALYQNNVMELGDFIGSLSTDEFSSWVYKLYKVPEKEQDEIEAAYEKLERKRKRELLAHGKRRY